MLEAPAFNHAPSDNIRNISELFRLNTPYDQGVSGLELNVNLETAKTRI